MDNCYCLIRIVPNRTIVVYYFDINKNISRKINPICFTNKSANYLYYLLCSHKYISQQISLNHALYLGQELYKAEIALIFGQVYVQN